MGPFDITNLSPFWDSLASWTAGGNPFRLHRQLATVSVVSICAVLPAVNKNWHTGLSPLILFKVPIIQKKFNKVYNFWIFRQVYL